MMTDMRSPHFFHQTNEFIIQFGAGEVIAVLKGEIGGMHGMNHSHGGQFPAVRQQNTQGGEIIIEHFEFFRLSPGVMGRIEGGVIPLTLTADGIGIEMLAHLIYAVNILPFSDALELPWRYIPAGAGKGFGDNVFFAKLLGSGGNLAGHHFIPDISAQKIYAGLMLKFIERHYAAGA